MPNIRTPKGLMVLVEFFQLTGLSVAKGTNKFKRNQYIKQVTIHSKRRQHERILKQAARQQAFYKRMSWRDYQKSLNQTKHIHKRFRRILFGISGASMALVLYFVLPRLMENNNPPYHQTVDIPIESSVAQKQVPLELEKINVRTLLDDQKLLNLTAENFKLNDNDQHYFVETSLDPVLQTALIKRFDKVNSRYIGIVAMNPKTGRILAFTGFNKTKIDLNPCTTNKFPAASIFKIITAAAAAEKLGYSGDTQMKFNGQKHTLYKDQLKDRDNRYTNRISFRNSFAQSINPVFGKIGSSQLGKETLLKYGEAFGFNHKFNSEIKIAPSHLNVTEDTYQWAEIACGFNRDTTLSPIHAAMIVSIALNGGQIIEPTIIDRIINSSGQIVYNGPKPAYHHVISAKTSDMIQKMMETTVRSGTAHKTFRGYSRDEILKRLVIGGKTGSIYNKAHDARFDWFVGFAKTKDRSEKMVISVVVAHEEYIGRRAGEYAWIAFKTHFQNYFAKKEAKQRLQEKS
jgi:peptidoglycan glycosyltransferase